MRYHQKWVSSQTGPGSPPHAGETRTSLFQEQGHQQLGHTNTKGCTHPTYHHSLTQGPAPPRYLKLATQTAFLRMALGTGAVRSSGGGADHGAQDITWLGSTGWDERGVIAHKPVVPAILNRRRQQRDALPRQVKCSTQHVHTCRLCRGRQGKRQFRRGDLPTRTPERSAKLRHNPRRGQEGKWLHHGWCLPIT